jgi:hypothetical protein
VSGGGRRAPHDRAAPGRVEEQDGESDEHPPPVGGAHHAVHPRQNLARGIQLPGEQGQSCPHAGEHDPARQAVARDVGGGDGEPSRPRSEVAEIVAADLARRQGNSGDVEPRLPRRLLRQHGELNVPRVLDLPPHPALLLSVAPQVTPLLQEIPPEPPRQKLREPEGEEIDENRGAQHAGFPRAPGSCRRQEERGGAGKPQVDALKGEPLGKRQTESRGRPGQDDEPDERAFAVLRIDELQDHRRRQEDQDPGPETAPERGRLPRARPDAPQENGESGGENPGCRRGERARHESPGGLGEGDDELHERRGGKGAEQPSGEREVPRVVPAKNGLPLREPRQFEERKAVSQILQCARPRFSKYCWW